MPVGPRTLLRKGIARYANLIAPFLYAAILDMRRKILCKKSPKGIYKLSGLRVFKRTLTVGNFERKAEGVVLREVVKKSGINQKATGRDGRKEICMGVVRGHSLELDAVMVDEGEESLCEELRRAASIPELGCHVDKARGLFACGPVQQPETHQVVEAVIRLCWTNVCPPY